MNPYKKIYISRINRAIDYIEENINKPLNLSEVAEKAYFSPFHFHRIFSTLTGETLNQFIKRLRVEKAASAIINSADEPIGYIAERFGFSSIAVFSRAFKECYGMSPTDFKNEGHKAFRKIRKINSKNCKTDANEVSYFRNIKLFTKKSTIMKTKAVVKQIPEMNLIYIRHKGDFSQIGKAYAKLMQWAGAKGLLSDPDFKTVTVYHDDPGITDIDNVRQSACIYTKMDIKPEGEFGSMKLKGGLYMCGGFEITETQFEEAWNTICKCVTESGYQPAEGTPFELYHKDPDEHPERKFVLDICIPVKPL